MYFTIMKKDFKRKKTMNCILLVFIVLATMFVASGLNNVLTVANGTDYYLDIAGIGDYCIITAGENSIGNIENVLSQESIVKGYRIEPVVYGYEDIFQSENGEILKTKDASILQSIEQAGIHLFDVNNNEVTTVAEGHVYVSGNFMTENDLHIGERIHIQHSGTTLVLELDGKVKDALLGSDLMGNTRFLMNEEDIKTLLANEEIALHYQGEIAYVDTDYANEMAAVITKIPAVNFSGVRAKIELSYVMDLIVAFVTLVLSVCLILVSFVILRFSINFTIMEEFREIGVMKAIGITSRKIRRLYAVKYLLLALVGAFIGFIASIPFGNLLIKSVSDNMILGNNMGIVTNILGAVLVILIIVLFAYFCTRGVKKLTPIDAIHSGQTGERYSKKSIYRMEKSHLKPDYYLALNDVISNPKRFVTIIISFFLCTLFVLLLVNTTETMKSDSLIGSIGSRADLYLIDTDQVMKDMGSSDKSQIQEKLDESAQELTALGMPAKYSAEIQYKYPVQYEGKDFQIVCEQGLNCQAGDYEYSEGVVPENAAEISITPVIAKMTGAGIGDVMTIDFGSEKIDCMVTAIHESMHQLGEVIRLHESAPTGMEYCFSILAYRINFTDNPDEKEIENRENRIKELYSNKEVMDATEYCTEYVAVADTMVTVQYMLLGITLIVVLLVTILMERAFIADEKSQIAILKAIGFQNKDIIAWHTCRFGIVAFLAVILAAVVSIPVTKLCVSPIFGMMGTSNISFNIVIWKVFGLYPLVVITVTLLVAWITSQYTRTIHSSETAYIE